MRKYIISFFIVLPLLLIIGVVGVAQKKKTDKSELERSRSRIIGEIAAARKMLNETKGEQKSSMAHLKALQAKLKAREELIGSLNSEMGTLQHSIASTTRKIAVINKNITTLKESYAKSVRYAYKMQSSQSMLAFLLSADNFNDALRRFQYLKKSRDYRNYQADKLRKSHKKLALNIKKLKKNKSKKQVTKTAKEVELQKLSKDKEAKNLVLIELLGKEKDLSKEIESKQIAAKKLNQTIRGIIRSEIIAAREKAAKVARQKAVEQARIKANIAAKEKAAAQRARRNAEIQREKEAKALALRKAEEEEQRQRDLAVKRRRQEELEKERIAAQKQEALIAKKRALEEQKKQDKQNRERYLAARVAEPKVSQLPASSNRKLKTNIKKVSPKVVANNRTIPVKVNAEPPSYKNSLSQEVQTTSYNFSASKGRLPWPVSGGFISTPFGSYTHPLEPKVKLNNLGIDISTSAGSAVRSVYSGVVSRVVKVAGSYTILINHGEYFTVYSYLSSALVKNGQTVTMNQNIGVVGKNDDGEHVVHFEICKVGANSAISNENPSHWISR